MSQSLANRLDPQQFFVLFMAVSLHFTPTWWLYPTTAQVNVQLSEVFLGLVQHALGKSVYTAPRYGLSA